MITVEQQAIQYSLLGWAVFPLCKNSKIPYKDTQGCHDASSDPFVITAMFERYPNSNIGIATGKKSGIFVLDVDNKKGKDGDASLAALEKEYGPLPRAPIQFTPSGGRHIIFTYPNGSGVKNSADKLGEGLDLRGDGGYIVASPSSIDGNYYAWQIGCDPFSVNAPSAPEWLLSKVDKTSTHTYDIDLGGKDLNIPDGRRNERLFEIVTIARHNGLTRKEDLYAFSHTTNMNHIKPPLPDEVVMGIVERVINYNATKIVQTDNGEPIIWDKKPRAMGGGYRPTFRNAMNCLRTLEPLSGLFSFNQFSCRVELMRKPIWSQGWHGVRTLEDNDILQLKKLLCTEYCEFPTAVLYEAVSANSANHPHHPVKAYLESVAPWDGTPRVCSFFSKYMGAEDNDYAREVSRIMFVAMIGRIYSPGCKFDHMVIAEGDQGTGKSMAIQALAEEFAGEVSLTDRDKDTVDKMLGLWICEVPELAMFKKKEIEELKSFITTRVDRARLAYRHTTQAYPRQSIFIGTVNPDDLGYFRDTSGNRRFLPVTCGKIDVPAIRLDRDQLMAEALVMFRGGASMHLEGEHIARAAEEQERRLTVDPWEQAVDDWLNDPIRQIGFDVVRINDVWQHALNGNITALGRVEQLRISGVLRKLGFVPKSVRVDGIVERRWCKGSEVEADISDL